MPLVIDKAEVEEIVERYERLVATVIASAGPFWQPEFDVSFPITIGGNHLRVEENVEGDRWRLRSIDVELV